MMTVHTRSVVRVSLPPPRPLGRQILRCALAGLVLAVLPLAGCAQMDPYQRPGMWQPAGVNNLNIAAQVANPNDLLHGRGDTSPHYRSATTPVTDMWAAKPDTASAAPGGAQAAAQKFTP